MEARAGATVQQLVGILDSDPTDEAASALASFGRAMQARNS
jgi:hypothetical protein